MTYGGLVVPQIPANLGPLFVQTDWRTESATSAAPAGASGLLVATSDTPPEDEWWLVERLIVTCTSTVNTAVDLYVGQQAPQYERDWTPQGGSTGNKGIAEYPRGLLMEPNQPLIVVWSGASTGATSFWAAQVQVYKRVG